MTADSIPDPSEGADEQVESFGVSRRNVLKMGVVAAAVAGVGSVGLRTAEAATLAAPGVNGIPDEQGTPKKDKAARFRVDIPDCPNASANVVSVAVEDLTIDERELTKGADWDYRVYGPGDAHYGSVTIRCRVGKEDNKELYAWWLACSQGKNIRKNISVDVEASDSSEVRRFNLFECFPTRWDAADYSPSSNVACETIVCKMGRVELA